MTHLKLRLFVAASATAVLSACAAIGAPGFGDASGGCRTVYVFTGGGVQPVNTCGAVPREEPAAKRMMAMAEPLAQPQLETEADPNAPPADPAVQVSPVTPVSAAALATAPYDKGLANYVSANDMVEAGDMAAFMGRVRADYAKKTNGGAWGYLIIDAIAADDPVLAQSVLDAMSGRRPPDWLSANHLRTWVYAANGRTADAQSEVMRMKNILPPSTLLGHRALLAEGTGDTAGALAIYGQVVSVFDNPNASEAGTPNFDLRGGAFIAQRAIALREADLLRALNRDNDAMTLLTRLQAASPDDPDVVDRIAKIKSGKDRPKVRTLKQAMAQALADEADVVEAREAFVNAQVSRGGKIPFNHLLSSMRQSALLLDPDNGDVRVAAVNRLYTDGKFEPALRLAQIGNPKPDQGVLLYSTAGLAALQLGSPETLEAMVERVLKVDPSAEAKIQAANVLTSANKTRRAIALVEQALKQGQLNDTQRVAAQMIAGQAHLQAGNVDGAVASANAAIAIQDDEATQQFLASMLVEGPRRAEGLDRMRHLMMESPDNTGLMNNLGYSLIDGYASQAELDEGYKLLKEAIRLTPDEPNLIDSIGWAYYQYGNLHEADRFIRMALEAYEPFDHWELSNHMGDIQWRLGKQDDARKHWRDALAAYPPANSARDVEEKLKNGLTTPAPVARETPEVPRETDTSGTNDI